MISAFTRNLLQNRGIPRKLSLLSVHQQRYLWHQRSVGIELEIIIPGVHSRRDLKRYLTNQLSTQNVPFRQWKVVGDDSVYFTDDKGEIVDDFSHEIVSPKRKLSKRLENAICALCEELQDLEAVCNVSTGLHVHVDGTGLTLEQTAQIAMNFAFFESVIDRYVCPSRRFDRNVYCLSLPHEEPDFESLNEWMKCHQYAIPWNPYGAKAHKLNFNNLRGSSMIDTIENRHHQGSVDPEEILNWIRFNLKMVQQTIDKGLYSNSMANYVSDVAKERQLWEFIDDDELKVYYTQKTRGIRVQDQFFTYMVVD